MMNKKAIAPFVIIPIILLVLIAIYLVLFLPIPAFTELRTIINYFLIVILWIVLQAGFIYAYFELIKYAVKFFSILKEFMNNSTKKINKFLIFHSR